jgi:hypothetical protein
LSERKIGPFFKPAATSSRKMGWKRVTTRLILLVLLSSAIMLWVFSVLAPVSPVNCAPGIPCEHPTEVDIRFIVLAYNRPTSLHKCLSALDSVELDGHIGHLDIFIDRNEDGEVDNETLHVAESFVWSLGETVVHVQQVHVGLYGQWIDSWRPKRQSKELAIIVEDDIDISPFAYRWVRLGHQLNGHKHYISAYSLQDYGVTLDRGPDIGKEVREIRRDILQYFPAFLYPMAFPWGLAPHPDRWREFQDWFHSPIRVKRPYVREARAKTRLYKQLEKDNFENSMWTAWFLYFCHRRKLLAVLSNTSQLRNSSRLSCHRQEPGLHFHTPSVECRHDLMTSWSDVMVASSPDLPLIGFDGRFVRMA